MNKILRFEINLGSLCNFKCKYCFENGEEVCYPPTQLSEENLTRYIEYINWVKKTYHKNDKFKVVVYGGEPFLHLDKINKFIQGTYKFVDNYYLMTNVSLVEKYKDVLLKLKEEDIMNKVTIDASFDFILQDETRQAGTYNIVREGIKWLYNNGLCTKAICVFSAKNFHRIDEVFFDFIKLKKELPNLILCYNIDRFGNIPLELDELSIRQSLEKVKTYLELHPEFVGTMKYNNSAGWKRASIPTEGCYYQNMFIAMCDDGSLYPGYECLYETDVVRKLLYIGHIQEPFESIERKRRKLVNSLPKNPKQECKDCTAHCRVFPWRVLKNDLSQWWDIPEGGHCKIHNIMSEYL